MGKTQVRLSENRQTRERIDIRQFRGVSVRRRHRLNWSRIASTGRESIFSDTGCVRQEKTRVNTPENRQDRQNNGKWAYGMGSLRKKLTTDEEPNTSAKRKNLLLRAVKTVDQGEFVIKGKGRSGKYIACEKEYGRPVWYLYVEQ